MLACIDRFYEEMMKRGEDMKLMENYRTGKTTLTWDFRQISLSLMNMWHLWKCSAQRKTRCPQQVKTNRYAWAAGWLLPDSRLPASGRKVSGDGIRDQFNFRVALGRMSEMGYGMMFGKPQRISS